jgi:hypothetical protein
MTVAWHQKSDLLIGDNPKDQDFHMRLPAYLFERRAKSNTKDT